MKEYKCKYFQVDWYDEKGDTRQEKYERDIKVRVKDNDNRFLCYDEIDQKDLGIAISLIVDKDFFEIYQEEDWLIIDFT